MIFMSTPEVNELREAVKAVKDQVSALTEIALKNHRETLLMRKSLRSCQSHCHVVGQSRWRNLWAAIRNLFSRSSLTVVDIDEDIEKEISTLRIKLSPETADAQ